MCTVGGGGLVFVKGSGLAFCIGEVIFWLGELAFWNERGFGCQVEIVAASAGGRVGFLVGSEKTASA